MTNNFELPSEITFLYDPKLQISQPKKQVKTLPKINYF